MTPEAQRIAIAEACPFVEWNGTRPFWRDSRGSIIRFDPLNDLNAMHEAEKVLMHELSMKLRYLEWLGWEDDWIASAIAICHATAAQRAEAFLRTLGKWEDGQ